MRYAITFPREVWLRLQRARRQLTMEEQKLVGVTEIILRALDAYLPK